MNEVAYSFRLRCSDEWMPMYILYNGTYYHGTNYSVPVLGSDTNHLMPTIDNNIPVELYAVWVLQTPRSVQNPYW